LPNQPFNVIPTTQEHYKQIQMQGINKV